MELKHDFRADVDKAENGVAYNDLVCRSLYAGDTH